ncbi:MAG: gliding motility protein GldN [Bacteroidia bacterium]|nr:gliding motility protein GldN [Bacteroidia bacterium]
MRKSLLNFCACFFVLFTGNIMAQTVLRDDVYDKQNTPSKRVIPYIPLREADVMWKKVVWRVIDLREKINLPLYYPLNPTENRKSLWDVIKKEVWPDTSKGANNLQPGKAMAFYADINNFDNGFVYSYSKDSLVFPLKDLINKGLTYSYDNLKNAAGQDIPQPYTSEDIVQYIIKEEWFFDKQRSVMDVRILGICPVARFHDATDGTPRPDQAPLPLFWVYYPQMRDCFSHIEVFNPYNDEERRTLEDIIWKRQFSSYIVQESNVYNRKIADYETGIDAQLEAEKIKNKMFNLEHDMWEY